MGWIGEKVFVRNFNERALEGYVAEVEVVESGKGDKTLSTTLARAFKGKGTC